MLVEPDDPAAVLALAARAARLNAASLEVVPAARTVSSGPRPPRRSPGSSGRVLDGSRPAAAAPPPRGDEVVLDVRYDGADLADVAGELGLDPTSWSRAHAPRAYVVAFCGFAPGFAYLTGLDPALHVARLAEPRTARARRLGRDRRRVHRRVPPRRPPAAGGCSDAPTPTLWDVDARPAGAAGARAPACGSGRDDRDRRARSADDRAGSRPAGLRRARRRRARAPSTAARCGLANRLVGNRDGAAVLEMTLGGLTLRAASTPRPSPLTGARVPRRRRLGCRRHPAGRLRCVRLGAPPHGLRSYLAVRGGIAVDAGARLAQHRHAQRPRPGAAARRRPAARRPAARGAGRRACAGAAAAGDRALPSASARATTGSPPTPAQRCSSTTVDGAQRQRPRRRAARRARAGARAARRAAQRGDAARRAAGAAGRAPDPVRPGRAGDRRLPGHRRASPSWTRAAQLRPGDRCASRSPVSRQTRTGAAPPTSARPRPRPPGSSAPRRTRCCRPRPSARPRSAGWRRRP